MNRLIDTAIGHTRTVLSTLVLVLIAGTYAYVTVPKEAEPDINIPQLYVNVSHEGISPEDAERLLIKPIEQQLRDIEGKPSVSSAAVPLSQMTRLFPSLAAARFTRTAMTTGTTRR